MKSKKMVLFIIQIVYESAYYQRLLTKFKKLIVSLVLLLHSVRSSLTPQDRSDMPKLGGSKIIVLILIGQGMLYMTSQYAITKDKNISFKSHEARLSKD